MSAGRIDTDALLARIRISDVVSRRTKLRKAGRELVGLCPFHSERSPSFVVYDATGGYHCFGCGANGDAIRFLMDSEHVDFRGACEMLANGDLPVVSEVERAAARAEDAAARAASIELAVQVWRNSVALNGKTAADVYLQSRGIVIKPKRFRFARCPAWFKPETGETGPDLPALVCGVTDEADQFIGVQRIFLRDGGRAKADMKNPKLSLGRPAGGAIRLGGVAQHIVVVEGPEDGASVRQTLMRSGDVSPVWIACGTSMMPQIKFPPEVRKITIGGDNNKAGRAAAGKAKDAYQDRGLEVRAVYPDDAFGDWNDQLRGIRK